MLSFKNGLSGNTFCLTLASHHYTWKHMNSTSNYHLQALEPFLEMLKDKESVLSRNEWEQLVLTTIERIATAPEQYLSASLRPSQELTSAIELIFKERLN